MGASCTKAGREEAAFLKAAKEGDCRTVQQAITSDVEWAHKVQTWNGQTVFHLAARYGRLDVLDTAVEAVRFNPAGPEKWSKLLRMGHSTDALLRTFCNLPDARCQTPLHLACIYGHADLALRLLELGSTPWAWDELGGRTPLHYAASMGHVDVIRVIASHNAPAPTGEALRRPNTSRTRLVDICNDSGYTPLHYAVWAGNTASIRALTSYDASLSARNVACGGDWVVSCLKCTPLHLAAHKGNETVVKLLLSAYVQSQPPQGADAPPITDRRRRDPRRHVNANRQLPYHMAVARNYTRLAEILHPDVPFSFILTPAEMESRLYGVAKLAALASKVLQAKLLADIEAAVTAIAAAPRGGGGGGGSINAAGRTRSGSVAALTGAVAAAAAAGQAGGAAAAQQVLAAATARLRAAGERSLGGANSLSAADGGALAAAVGADGASGRQSRKQSFDQQGQVPGQGRVLVPSRLSHDSAAVALAAANGAGAVVAAAGKGSPPGSNGSSATSGGDSEREPLAVEPMQALASRARPAEPATAQGPPREAQAQQPLPLPPAPLSPFLPAASAGSAAPGAGPALASVPRVPPTFGDAASAFATFAAEPFDAEPPAGGQALTHAGSSSISLAALAHSRAQQAAAATSPPPLVAATSVSIAALARSRGRGGVAGNGAGGAAGSTAAGGGGKSTPGRSRSLRKLFTGGRMRRSNTQAGPPSSPAGGSAANSDGDEDDPRDDLDAILNAMRPSEDAMEAGPAAAPPGPGDDAGPSRHGQPATPPAAAAAQQQKQLQQRRGGGGGLTFWRRTASQGLGPLAQQVPPDGGSTCGSSMHAGMAASTALAAAANGGPRGPSPTLLGASGTLSAAPSGSLPPALPPGIIEARTSVDAPPPPHQSPRQSADVAAGPACASPSCPGDEGADPDESPPNTAAPTVAVSRAQSGAVEGLRRNSISLAVLARGGGPSTGPGDDDTAAIGPGGEGAPAVDGAMLAMLASLVEAPQHVLRRYRLLQLTHGLDLQDLLRDHSDLQATGPGARAPATADGAGAGGPPGTATAEVVATGEEGPGATASPAVAGRAASAAADGMPSPRYTPSPFAGALQEGASAVGTPPAGSVPSSPAPSMARQYTGPSVLPSGAAGAGAGSSPGLAAVGSTTPANAVPASLAGQLLRTLSSQAASESGEGMCGVCFDQPDTLRITGCGHRLCADCSRELCKINTFKPALCPFCRGLIGGFAFVGR